MGLALAAAAFAAYWWSDPVQYNQYVHFVWQADAFLHGRAWFPYPIHDGVNLATGAVLPGVPDNDYYQDVFPLRDAAGSDLGRVLLPFPPLPAVVLLPFVAAYGLSTNQQAIAIVLAALGVLATWWTLGGLALRLSVRVLVTLIFATGTAWWWAAAAGTTWYFAHLVALGLAMLAVGVTLRHDPGAASETVIEEDSPFGYGLAPTVGRAWEQAFAEAVLPTIRPVILRTSFVIGRNGGALSRLTKLARFGLGGTVGHGRQGMSWLHELDMNRIFERALTDASMTGAYIATAPNPVSNAEFMRELRRAMKIPIGLPAPAFLVRLGAPLLMRTDPELALYGRYCIPKRLQAEGFDYRFPALGPALEDLCR